MLKRDLLVMANRNLWRRKARTILTCTGVLIGTAAIVVMLSLGIGLSQSMEQSMAQWGSLTIIRVHPGAAYDREGNPLGEARRLNDETVQELRAIEGVIALSPAYEVSMEARLGRKQGWLNIVGLDTSIMPELEFSLAEGRLPAPMEKFTLVAGSQVAGNFYDERLARRGGMEQPVEQPDSSELLDQRITATVFNQYNPDKRQNYNFMIVGILDESNMDRSWQVFGSLEDVKRIRTFQQQGGDGGGPMPPGMIIEHEARAVAAAPAAGRARRDDTSNDYNFILLRTEDVGQTKAVSAQLREMGFNAWSMADNLEGIETFSRTVQAVLGGIGAITLLVAALGITNTMIMSIYERTREIGIMKVVGASFGDVRTLFLAEASLIGFMGGVLGLTISYLVSFVINRVAAVFMQQGMGMGMGPEGAAARISVIPLWLALFAVGFAVLIGIASGLYPASRAVKLSPIVAIRGDNL